MFDQMFVIGCVVTALLIWFSHTWYDHELLHPVIRFTVGTLCIYVGLVIWLADKQPELLVGIMLFNGVAGATTLLTRLWAYYLNKRSLRGLNGANGFRAGLGGIRKRVSSEIAWLFGRGRGKRSNTDSQGHD